MSNIGEQIVTARKARAMTQDQLAAAMNMTRTGISNWETGRRQPDAESLLRLSEVLSYSFETQSLTEEREQPASPESGTELTAEQSPQAPQTQPARSWVDWGLSAACTAVIVAAMLGMLLLGIRIGRSMGQPTAEPERPAVGAPALSDNEQYTKDFFRQTAPRLEGCGYLSVETILNTQRNGDFDMWMYEYVYHEKQDAPVDVEEVVVIIFAGEQRHEQRLTAEDLAGFGLPTTIPARGRWSFTGGFPVQDSIDGVGVALYASDAGGNKQVFTGFLPLSR